MFEETRFDIYTSCELIEVRRPQRTEIKKAAESCYLVINELIEK
ncbi:7770_t:CDS:1, partial [Scutellospora calospora]